MLFNNIRLYSQTETVIAPSNRSTVNLEKNILFYADKRFAVTQGGSANLSLPNLFDGNYQPLYTGSINSSDPYTITIESLPGLHVQAGAWLGWTTRFWGAVKFKVEVYNIYNYGNPDSPQPNTWITVADIDNYSANSFIVPVSEVAVTKIRFTFYKGSGPGNAIGLSELFFIHPEAAVAYDGLMVKYDSYGNVGIGTSTPAEKLSVNGKIRAQEVKVETSNWPDYVFKPDYKLPSLIETEKHIKEKGHLPGIPTAKEAETNGVDLGEMNKKLLQKIEELTLIIIEQNKRIDKLEKK